MCSVTVYLSHQDSNVPHATVQYEDCARRSVFIGTQQYNSIWVILIFQTVITSPASRQPAPQRARLVRNKLFSMDVLRPPRRTKTAMQADHT